jgi:hypothetical protein
MILIYHYTDLILYDTYLCIFCRIELAEVEFAISSHTDVKQVVVIVKDERLVAFVSLNINNSLKGQSIYESSSSSSSTLLYDTIVKHTKKTLPHYMIPKTVIHIKDEFPKTANGKLDKLTLATMVDDHISISPCMLLNSHADNNNNNNNYDDYVDKNLKSTTINKNGNMSMATFLIKSVKRINNQDSTLHSSFAAVGIDSLAAVMFKNYLSQSLGEFK